MSLPRVRKALKIGAGVLLILVLGAIVAIAFLTRSNIGQAFVVEQVLRRIEGTLNGEIVISGLRSEGLHRGARLLEVQVTAEDGGPILAVDSVEAEYSIGTMLGGDVALTGLTLWRPRLTITKEAPDQPFNLAAFLDGTESLAVELGDASDLTEAGVRFLFEEVDIRDGSVDVRYPLTPSADPASRFLSEPGPDGRGFMRVFGLQGIDGHLDGVVAADPTVDGLTMNVIDLAMEGRVFEEPVRVEGLAGRVAWSGDRILIDVEAVSVLGATAAGSGAVELVEGGVPNFTLDAVVESLDVSELRWLEPRLPDARASGRIGVDYGSEGFRGSWSTGRLAIDGGEIEGEGTLRRLPSGEAALQDVTLDVSAIPVAALQEFIPIGLPLEGRLYGNVDLAGTMDSLRVAGRVDLLEPGAGPTGGEIDGVLHLRHPLGVTGLTGRMAAFDLGLVNRVAEGLLLDGNVILDIQAAGRLDTGIRVVAGGTRPDSISEASHVSLQGIVQEVDEEIRVSLDGELSPLSMPGIFGEESPLSRFGVARGTVHVEGPLSALVLRSDLTEGGRLTLESRFDVRAPLASYRIRGEAVDYDAVELVPGLPQGTILSGSFDLVGEGGNLRSTELVGGMSLSASRFADLTVDTVSVDVRISNGLVTMDSVRGRIGGVTMEGAGRLATAGVASPEEFRVSFETENLEGLRPLLLGADVIAGDTLSVLERQILEFEAIDPDTLPTLSEVLVSGRMAGELVVGGSFESLSARGRALVEDGAYGGNRVEQAEVSLSVTGLFSPERELSVQLDAGPMRVFEREFDSISASYDYGDPTGSADVLLVRSPEESYQGRLAFEEESDVRTLHLDELVLRFPDERWNLGGPGTISWDADGLTFRDFRLRSPGLGGMRLQAQGRLPFDGEADFRLEADALDVRRIAGVLQLEEVLEGMLNLDLSLTGTDEEPVIGLALLADGFRFRAYVLDRLEADVNYADRRAAGDVALRSDSLQVLTLAGELPLNLSFNSVEERLPDEVIDLVVVSDLLPLSLIMAPFPGFEEVVGTMSGRVDVGGTSGSLAPRGRLTMDGGGAFLTGLGVRHQDVGGTLDWFPDGRLEVDLRARALGTASVEGTVTLTTASDPGFDLDVRFDEFQALDRRDATGRLSGDVRLEGSYSRPVISGDLFVDEGTLFVEEFQRAADVSDLFFERSAGLAASSAVDTTALGFRPFIAGENPFLQNIRMENTTLTVRRDSWIRSELMNVELDGELDLLYDRQNQDLALVGSLGAVRGSYLYGLSAFRRQFQVDGGTLRFLGTPGIDPDLNLTATNDIRTPEGDRFTITAAVTGTLVSPRVALSSEEPGFTEDDLLSYLWFGRPTYALTSGQSQALGTAAIGALGTLGLSSFSNQLGAVVTQELGLDFLDYLSITQQDMGTLGASNLGGALSTTVVQTGFYVADDMFLTLLFRPASGEAAGTDRWPGLRFEWVPSESYTIETYFEDRFFRGRAIGFGELGVQSEKGLGLSLFREWAY